MKIPIKKPNVIKKNSWKAHFQKFTVWIGSVGLAILGTIAAIDPLTITAIWSQMPGDIKAVLPQWLPRAIGFGCIAITLIGSNYERWKSHHERQV